MTARPETPAMEPGFTWDQAIVEAGWCLLCHEPPCSKGCPAGTDPGAFIQKFRLRNVTGAIRTIKENNILGGACGVLCPTARMCEKACSACGIDRPVRIGKIQRFLVDHAREIGFRPFDNPRYEKPTPRREKVAVIGAGPSGLSCAAELAKNGFGVTIFEEREEPGGVLRYGVPSFRFDKEFLAREIDDLKCLGVEFRCSTPLRKRGEVEALLKNGYQAVFIGTGLWEPMSLFDDAGRGEGIYSSIRFLEAFRTGKTDELAKNCAGKAVAIDCARVARKLGARDVYLVYRRSYEQMPAEEDERSEALAEGIHFLLLNQPVGYMCDAQKRLSGLRLIRTQLGGDDTSGRRKPVEIPGSEWVLDAQTVVEAIENQASAGSPELYPGVNVTGARLIVADAGNGRTSLWGVFAGGDIVRGPATVVEAIADGKDTARAVMAHFGLQTASGGK